MGMVTADEHQTLVLQLRMGKRQSSGSAADVEIDRFERFGVECSCGGHGVASAGCIGQHVEVRL